MNLYWQSRNTRMMDLIRAAIRDNHSRRVIVLTGSEHKYFFDREFLKGRDAELIDLATLLPLKKLPLDPAVTTFLEEDDDSPYFEKGYPQDGIFGDKLLPLVHGPDMDVFPEKIPAANITRAAKVLDRWTAANPQSDARLYEEAWLDFLREHHHSRGAAVDSIISLDVPGFQTPELRE